MSTYIYRRTRSTGARELAAAIGGTRLRRHDNTTFRQGDVVVAWGENLALIPGVRTLNAAPILSKFQEATTLRAAGVPTVQVSQTRPAARAAARPALPQAPTPLPVAGPDPARRLWEAAQEVAGEFDTLDFSRGPVAERTLEELVQAFSTLRTALRTPPPMIAAPRPPTPTPVAPQVDGEWVGRMNDHTGGIDLLTPPRQPDFWVKKETFVNEYRVHSFNGRSIRAGRKVVREGFALPDQRQYGQVTRNASPWVRSYDGGWMISYDGFESTNALRTIAAQAVAALGLTFGAVDIGEKADGSLVVLEVNRAPGLEGGTVNAYAHAIRNWEQDPTPARPNRPRAARGRGEETGQPLPRTRPATPRPAARW